MEGLPARWALATQEFDFTITYRKGIEHGNADALSRQCTNKKCSTCVKLTRPSNEPMISSKLPKHLWKGYIATDLFELNKQTYILYVDYYSHYPKVIKLNSTTSLSVINAMNSVFSRHGIPHTVISDNGPQYDSVEMK